MSHESWLTRFLRTIHLSPELIWHPILSVINELNEFSIFDERLNKVEINNEGIEASKISKISSPVEIINK